MENLALKYRPRTFEDVVSQKEIKDILLYQIEEEAIKHAYLFCGGAGTGKTTSARIFAQEVNNGIGGPIEIDAATNTGVDNVREIVESAQMRPIEGNYKVFIIDECHMLSNGAWNALLKTLEEPPSTAIFILCTTDPQKIPATIISRVQRFDFKKMTVEQLVDRLEFIIENENEDDDYEGELIEYEDEALEYISKLAQGGMRDAITSLDTVLDLSNEVTMENVVKALGVPDTDDFMDLTISMLNEEKKNSLEIVNEMFMSGRDLKLTFRHYANFLVEYVKVYFLDDSSMVQLPSYLFEEIAELISENIYRYEDVLKLLETINELVNRIKWEGNPLPIVNLTILLFEVGD